MENGDNGCVIVSPITHYCFNMTPTGLIKIGWDLPELISFEIINYSQNGWLSYLQMYGRECNGMIYKCQMRVLVF